MHIFFVKFEMYLLWRLQLFYIQNICMTSRPSMVSTKWSIACSAPPQISVSKLTLFVLAVYLLAIAVCLWNSVCCFWNPMCCRPCFSLPHGGTFSCTTVSLHCLPCIPCLYLHCPSHPSVYHAKCISKLSWIDCPLAWAGPEDLSPRAKGQGLEDLSLALMCVR